MSIDLGPGIPAGVRTKVSITCFLDLVFRQKYDNSSIKIGTFVGLCYRFQAIQITKIRTNQLVPIVNSLKIVAKKIQSIEIWLCDKFYLADIHFVGSWEIKDSFSNGERQF